MAKWLHYIPNGQRIYNPFPFQGPPKFTQNCIFGLKINRLATLPPITDQCEDFSDSVASQRKASELHYRGRESSLVRNRQFDTHGPSYQRDQGPMF
jgi:hypothetical protein